MCFYQHHEHKSERPHQNYIKQKVVEAQQLKK